MKTSVIEQVFARVSHMKVAAEVREREDMAPALIVYSPEGFCRLRADPAIISMLGDLRVPFEDRPLYGCAQEIDRDAKAPFRVLSKRSAEERVAAAEHRRIHGSRPIWRSNSR